MSKRGARVGRARARRKHDFYPTIDARAVAALVPFVPPGTVFGEPCAGAGDLVQLLEAAGLVCDWGIELDPPGEGTRNRWPIGRGDALQLGEADMGEARVLITNPPWTTALRAALIAHLAALRPTWLLFDAGWLHTIGAGPLGALCTDVVSVGRLQWIADSKHSAMDDCAWYRFEARPPALAAPTRFHWRRP